MSRQTIAPKDSERCSKCFGEKELRAKGHTADETRLTGKSDDLKPKASGKSTPARGMAMLRRGRAKNELVRAKNRDQQGRRSRRLPAAQFSAVTTQVHQSPLEQRERQRFYVEGYESGGLSNSSSAAAMM
jgi:hypothetical protein